MFVDETSPVDTVDEAAIEAELEAELEREAGVEAFWHQEMTGEGDLSDEDLADLEALLNF